MSVDVNNNFNSAEDLVQYALGSMDVYSVSMTYAGGASCAPGIIALDRTEALIKFLGHLPPKVEQNYTLRINLCE